MTLPLSKSYLFLILLLVLNSCFLFAQDKTTCKFGVISAADFNPPNIKFDSSANAVIIADIGYSRFQPSNEGSFNLLFTRFMRVKIINKNGYDIANQEIGLYHNLSASEKISSFKASTFNFENGIVKETKLDEKLIYDEHYSRNITIRKFSMPALKDGSVFDIEYTIKSPFVSELRPWSFQGKYPRLWSEYEVTIAFPYHYEASIQGDDHFDINTSKEIYEFYTIRDQYSTLDEELHGSGNSSNIRWVKKNVPSIREEPFISSMGNYNSRVTFQLNYFQWSKTSDRHDFRNNWVVISRDLMTDESFGKSIAQGDDWLGNDLKNKVKLAKTREEGAKIIFSFVRDNFKCDGQPGIYMNHTLKEVLKNKSGNIAEINILLTAMISQAGFEANPVVLSTRPNGYANINYPMIEEYNYVVCSATIGDNFVTLDASQTVNGFGQLPSDCYNGYGHMIRDEIPMPIQLSSDSLRENKMTNVMISNAGKDKLSGSYNSVIGNLESSDIRKEIHNSSQEKFETKTQVALGTGFSIGNFGIDSIKLVDYPITVHYDFEMKTISSGDFLYFNPVIGVQHTVNPFTSFERRYPVEMPSQMDEIYVLNMEIPSGFQTDELPKSVRVAYNETDGLFEYLIQKGDNNIQLQVHIKLNKAFFPVEEYGILRDFFALIAKKESEQIVFRKIK